MCRGSLKFKIMSNNEFKQVLNELKKNIELVNYWRMVARNEYIDRFGVTPEQNEDDLFLQLLKEGIGKVNIKFITECAVNSNP